MIVSKRFFPPIIEDNEETFIAMLLGIIESVDDLSSVEISKFPDCYHFRIAPSEVLYGQVILKEVLNFNNLFGIKLNISKSIKTSGSIVFQINLN